MYTKNNMPPKTTAEITIAPLQVIKAMCSENINLSTGDSCVVRNNNYTEYGIVKSISKAKYPGNAKNKIQAVILRRGTMQDQARASENKLFEKNARRDCQEEIDKIKLNIKLVSVNYSLDRTVLRVLFRSQEKVDCSKFINDISKKLQVYVTIHSVSSRQAAALIGGIGPCGKRLCCMSWLKEPPKVSVKMAKTQGVSLNPVSLNGMCGKPKCCLRFEYNMYRQLSRNLPRKGDKVNSPEGNGEVQGLNIPTQKIKVRLDNGHIRIFSADNLKKLGKTK
jgi:cell fate regulator YaaT (PSP1 superfamily)